MFARFATLISTLSIFVLCSEAVEGSGGWALEDEYPIASSGRCSIQRIDASQLSQEEFLSEFAYNRPLIVYNYTENTEFRSKCSKQSLLSEWGSKTILLASANTYSYKKVESTLSGYVEEMRPQNDRMLGNETLYLFGDIDTDVWSPLLNNYKLPKWILPNHIPAKSFGIAAVGTGVPFHFHGPGFGEVIYGSKYWFLYDYNRRPAFDPDRSTFDWFKNNYTTIPDDMRPLECLLKPNELIYFPDKWWHATLNTKTSVFVSTFLSPTNKQSKKEL